MLDLIPFENQEAYRYVLPIIKQWIWSWLEQNKRTVKPYWKQELITWLYRNRQVSRAKTKYSHLRITLRGSLEEYSCDLTC